MTAAGTGASRTDIRCKVDPGLHPDLFAELEKVQSRDRAERLRYLASIGLLFLESRRAGVHLSEPPRAGVEERKAEKPVANPTSKSLDAALKNLGSTFGSGA